MKNLEDMMGNSMVVAGFAAISTALICMSAVMATLTYKLCAWILS